ncbi:MAG: hypothetical protein AB7V58_10855 [Solirubrobacterales bacterium]
MNLEAQIELITVPQEFTRLCNAVLSAEHGDDFLPIDDDRADRGNDGYLKSAKQVFAVHCFKRAQSKGIDAPIRRKMLGDLGKAKTLKEQGIWEVDAWTFLSNYPIPESVGRDAVQLGRRAGIDVTWKGPGYLAGALQRHHDIRALFPSLQVSEIADRLDGISEALGEPPSRPPDRVPRTLAEKRALLAQRPGGWEYLLFAAVLLEGKEDLEMKWRDHEVPPFVRPHMLPALGEATSFLSAEFQRLAGLTEAMMRVFPPEVQEEAFGVPGSPGDPVRIEHFAIRIVQTYEEILDWAGTLRAVEGPDVLKPALELAPHMADQPVSEFRDFVDLVVREIDRVPAFVEGHQDGDDPLRIDLTLTISLDQEIMDEFHRRLKRARRKIRWGF